MHGGAPRPDNQMRNPMPDPTVSQLMLVPVQPLVKHAFPQFRSVFQLRDLYTRRRAIGLSQGLDLDHGADNNRLLTLPVRSSTLRQSPSAVPEMEQGILVTDSDYMDEL